MSILTAQSWKTNGHLIADVAKLGYLDGDVLDTTYGMGVFWNQWKPANLVACDLDPSKSPIGYSVDFTNLPFEDDSFDSVVIDPPYKLEGGNLNYNGTKGGGANEFVNRYGIEKMKWQDRHQMMKDGLTECCCVSRKFVLMKCMDQVVSGHKRWQTIELTNWAAVKCGARLVDRFDLLVTPRPQPPGRRQLHSQINYSTLLVFEVGKIKKK